MAYSYKRRKKKNITGLVIIVVILLVVISIITTVVILINKNIKNKSEADSLSLLYRDLFNDKNYLDLIKNMDIALKKNPSYAKYLVYRGYSYFLLAEEENDLRIRKKYLKNALLDLRKAMAIGVSKENIPDIYFCLGKIYYYKGQDYYYQALQYLNKSIEAGNTRKDLYYTIGVINSHMGNYKKSAAVFIKALDEDESDLLLLAIANSLSMDSDFENAKNYIDKVLKKSYDPKVKEKCYFLLGEIQYKQEYFNEALENFSKVIELNENNASAYFYRGEIYYLANEVIKARAEWRKTLEIDPSHIKALKRFY